MKKAKMVKQEETNWEKIDFLTKMPNRYAFERAMKKLLQKERDGRGGYVLLVDIDDFRLINQGYGHDTGDIIILNFSVFLKARFIHTHRIFRISSDSFLLICESPPQIGQLQQDIEVILARCQSPWKIHDTAVYFTVGISALYYPRDGGTLDEIYQNLYSALYKTKEKGRNSYYIYQREIENISDVLLRHREIENMLRESVKRDFAGFGVHYQPIYQPTANRIIGAEALLRFSGADGKIVSPELFISIAERTGLIAPIGEYALRAASAACKSVLDMGYPNFFMNVNVSIHELQQPGYADRTIAILDEAGLPHGHMVMEITESLAASSLERVRRTCQILRDSGIQIALDDFGTGYSSLNMIRTMPIDLIKIDRIFVKDVATDAFTQSFVRMITQLGHTLNLTVCAEGIEEVEQLKQCRDMGIDFIQGYLCHRALPQQELFAVVESVNGAPGASTSAVGGAAPLKP